MSLLFGGLMTGAETLAKRMIGGSPDFAIMRQLLDAVAHNTIGDFDVSNGGAYHTYFAYLVRCHAVKEFSTTWKLTDFGKEVLGEIRILEM